MITTYIFDLDGVIVNTAQYHYLAWKRLANQLGIDFTEKDNELLKGVSRVRSLEIILNLGNKTLTEDEFKHYLIEKNEDYLTYIQKLNTSHILPGVERALTYLKSTNKKIALGSASKNAQTILKNVGLIHYFDALIDGHEVTHAKPDPEVFLLGAKRTQSAPEECVVFEDAVAGIQAANAAGMISIGIGQKDILNEANYIFSGFEEISTDFLVQISH